MSIEDEAAMRDNLEAQGETRQLVDGAMAVIASQTGFGSDVAMSVLRRSALIERRPLADVAKSILEDDRTRERALEDAYLVQRVVDHLIEAEGCTRGGALASLVSRASEGDSLADVAWTRQLARACHGGGLCQSQGTEHAGRL